MIRRAITRLVLAVPTGRKNADPEAAQEGGVFKGTIAALIVTGLSAAISFAMLSVLSRSLSEADFGYLASWLNAAFFLAVVSVSGQEMTFVKSWNEYLHKGDFGKAKGVLAFGFETALFGALVISTGLVVFAAATGTSPSLIAAVVLFVIAQTLCLFTSQTARIMANIVAGVVYREITWRIGVIVFVLVLMWFGQSLSVTTFFLVAAAGLIFAVVMQGTTTLRRAPAEVLDATQERDVQRWRGQSFRMWTAGLLEAASQYLDVVLIAVLLSPTDAGAYFIAIKLANLFLMLLDGLMLYSSKPIAALYHQGRIEELRVTLRHLAMITTGLTAIGLLAVWLIGPYVLAIFGTGYMDLHWLLLVLCAGTSAMALAGPTMNLLLLTGHEKLYLRNVGWFVVLRFAALAAGGWLYGLNGVAVSTALTMMCFAVVSVALVRRAVGVDPSAWEVVAGVWRPNRG